MKFRIKQFLVRIGRRLIQIEYVPYCVGKYKSLEEANKEIYSLELQAHDLRWQLQQRKKI